MSAGIYVLSLLVVEMMSRPSNTKSSGGQRLGTNCRGKQNVNLGTLLSSSLSSSLLWVGAGGGGGVQWF